MALTIGQVLADFPPGHEQLRKLLEDSHVASRQALDEVRTVSYVLHPPILDGLGLASALQWYLEGLKKRTEINILFEAPAHFERLSPEAERALFRIVQEGMTNVLRHSGGSTLKIGLSSTSKTVTLEIEDNGHGLNEEELAQLQGAATLGVGIAGMRERIRQLNGIFTLESNTDGTRVTATVPLDRNRYAAHPVGG
jgi:two-component system, NarL family, sensor kinase